MFAVLNIHKPTGLTSHDVVNRLRRLYGIKRIGHLGTLDPMAEGVLPVCLGQATRLIEYFPDNKRYTAEVTLGFTTTTLDKEGDVVAETDASGVDFSPAHLESVLARFRGTIEQQVPLYSAVHVKGKKLYELARQGKTTELPVRTVIIHRLDLLHVVTADPARPVLRLDVACSSGTYIRSLARDIGNALGTGATLTGLVRTEHGRFRLADAVELEALQQAENPADSLQSPVPYLEMPVVNLSESGARLLGHGMKVDPQAEPGGGVAVQLKPNALYLACQGDRPLAVVCYEAHKLRPLKVFPPG